MRSEKGSGELEMKENTKKTEILMAEDDGKRKKN